MTANELKSQIKPGNVIELDEPYNYYDPMSKYTFVVTIDNNDNELVISFKPFSPIDREWIWVDYEKICSKIVKIHKFDKFLFTDSTNRIFFINDIKVRTVREGVYTAEEISMKLIGADEVTKEIRKYTPIVVDVLDNSLAPKNNSLAFKNDSLLDKIYDILV